ncbi:MAG: hypothetical protein ACJ75R_06890 [Solirubrobacterales bacterium]
MRDHGGRHGGRGGGGRRRGDGQRRRGGDERPGGRHGGGGQPKGGVAVGTTANKPELVETIPIVDQPAKGRQVVLSFGPQTDTDCPLPDLAAGDKLRVFAELEATTDADDPNHPGLIGNAYSYSPEVTAWLLLASGPDEAEARQGRAIELARPWRQTVSHQQHHAVVTFADADLEIPAGGLPWHGPSHVNLVLAASSPHAKHGDVLLIGQNEKTPIVVQDMAGIRVVRVRGDGRGAQPVRESACLCAGIPVAKSETVVLSHELDDLRAGEQLLVKANLVTDAARLGYPARISTRLFLADSRGQTEPGGSARQAASWKGQLSKFTGFNCVPAEGPRTTQKFGVGAIRQPPGRPLFVNLVAVSAAPFGGGGAGDELLIDTRRSFLEVTRFPPTAG